MIHAPHPSTDLKLVFEPKVYLVGQSQVNQDGLDAFLADHDLTGWESSTSVGAQVLPEVGGRLCYMSFGSPRPGGNAAYLERIKQEKHGSVLEHATFTLIFAGVSRSLTHELVRHRAGMSYSQLSQRYVDESDVAFVVPLRYADEIRYELDYWNPALAKSLKAVTWLRMVDHAGMSYRYMVEFDSISKSDRKQAREAARSVLPNCTETKIQVTGNGRSWRHFIEQRGSAGADAEIRRLAITVLGVLNQAAPNLFGDYTVATNPEGVTCIATPHPKV